MANLSGFDIGSNYQGIINLGTVGTPGSGINEPLTAVATGYKVVTDGTGTGSPLQLATDAVRIASILSLTGAETISISSTGATALNAISLQAGTAATSGTTAQWSPTAFFSANAWNTTGAGSSVTVGFRMFARSVGGSINPTSSFVFEGTNDGTTFTEALTISTGGVFTFRNSVALGFATGILNIMNQNQQNVTRVNFGPNNAAATPALAVVTTSATGDTLSAIDSRTTGSAAVFLRGKLSTSAAYVNTTVTPTGYLVIFDSTGTSYRIPAVAGA